MRNRYFNSFYCLFDKNKEKVRGRWRLELVDNENEPMKMIAMVFFLLLVKQAVE